MRLFARNMCKLLAVGLGLLLAPAMARADLAKLSFSVSEDSTQPVLLDFRATPGVLLLCDSVGTNGSAPRQVNANPIPTGIWSCVVPVGILQGTVSEPSDVLVFEPNPGDVAHPSKVTMCSDIDTVRDPGDFTSLPMLCRGASATALRTTGDYAIQEPGEETMLERGPFDPPGVGYPGYGIITKSGEDFLAQYEITSDIPRTIPEPSSLLVIAMWFVVLAVGKLGAASSVGCSASWHCIVTDLRERWCSAKRHCTLQLAVFWW